ncbi:MAG: hypothetical protein H6813_02580 [Phycisphaeraceae bacterium]|nr:hypothetical protein [Phycisphaeraceae bacterium]MCB9848798.1 hypothetical protein [Phycisphaeraceae bacterium]
MELDGIGKPCLALGIAAAIAIFALSGCQVGDLVQANVPQSVRKVVPSEPRVSYNEAKLVYADWRASVERTAEQFQQELDRKAELVSLLSSLTNDALTAGIPVLESLPGGGLLATGLVGLGAWFLRSPGTTSRIAREKEASFNKGLEEGGTLASNGARPLRTEIAA